MTTQYRRSILITCLSLAAVFSPLALTAQTSPSGAASTATSPADTTTSTTTSTDVDQSRHHNYSWVGLLGLLGLAGLMGKKRSDDRVVDRTDSRRTDV
jgi:LPXTG-motif cell wall-anchored protein